LALSFSDDGRSVPNVLDFFRIHFEQPARVEGLMQADLPKMQMPGGGLPEGGEEADSKLFRIVSRWHPLGWWNSSRGRRIVFTDNGHDYPSPGSGLAYRDVVYSPRKDFFAFASGDAERDCTAYLEIYRRSDHRRIAKFRIESCSYSMYSIFYNMSWVSDRDFLYVTGFRSSDCFICRFEK